MREICRLTLLIVFLATVPAAAGPVTAVYTELPLATPINLTAEGTVDWVKWGVNAGGPGWVPVGKAGVVPIISRALGTLGTPPAGTSVVLIGIGGGNVLNFTWTDGSGPPAGVSDTIVTETILPAQFDYPLGLGASLTVPASAGTRVLDVYVQGFNADMVITATMSGGGTTSTLVAPSKRPPSDPPNNYSAGQYRVTFSGAGEVLTVTVRTVAPARPGSVGFPNAGFFAASLRDAAPTPGPLAPPTNFAAQVSGLNVTFTWSGSPGATSYQLEAGSGPSQSNLFLGDIGGGTSLAAVGPAGTYYARLRAKAGGTLSAPSNEILFTLGTGPCFQPGAPSNLAFSKAGALLTILWTAGNGATTYQLSAGTVPGASDVLTADFGGATSLQFSLIGVPPGLYYVRVVSVNGCGVSGPSNEVAIPIP